jgi:hypothetical protein
MLDLARLLKWSLKLNEWRQQAESQYTPAVVYPSAMQLLIALIKSINELGEEWRAPLVQKFKSYYEERGNTLEAKGPSLGDEAQMKAYEDWIKNEEEVEDGGVSVDQKGYFYQEAPIENMGGARKSVRKSVTFYLVSPLFENGHFKDKFRMADLAIKQKWSWPEEEDNYRDVDQMDQMISSEESVPATEGRDDENYDLFLKRNEMEHFVNILSREKMFHLTTQEDSHDAWLTGEVVGFYMELMQRRNIRQQFFQPVSVFPKPNCYFFNEIFYPDFAMSSRRNGSDDTGYRYSNPNISCGEPFENVDVFSYDLLFAVVNRSSVHWTLIVVDIKKKRIEHFNSLYSGNKPGSRIIEIDMMRRWLGDEFHYKNAWSKHPGLTKEASKRLDIGPDGAWTFHAWDPKVNGSPRQSEDYNCGVFALQTANYLSHGYALDFDTSDMPDFRRMMTQEIVQLKLFGEKFELAKDPYRQWFKNDREVTETRKKRMKAEAALDAADEAAQEAAQAYALKSAAWLKARRDGNLMRDGDGDKASKLVAAALQAVAAAEKALSDAATARGAATSNDKEAAQPPAARRPAPPAAAQPPAPPAAAPPAARPPAARPPAAAPPAAAAPRANSMGGDNTEEDNPERRRFPPISAKVAADRLKVLSDMVRTQLQRGKGYYALIHKMDGAREYRTLIDDVQAEQKVIDDPKMIPGNVSQDQLALWKEMAEVLKKKNDLMFKTHNAIRNIFSDPNDDSVNPNRSQSGRPRRQPEDKNKQVDYGVRSGLDSAAAREAAAKEAAAKNIDRQ